MGIKEAALREALIHRGLAPRSVTIYARAVRAADRWCSDAGYSLKTAPASVIADYTATLQATSSSRRQLRSALKHYWQITGRRNPPLAAIRVPRKPRGVCRALDETDVRRLAVAARERGDHKGLVVLLGLYLGLRRHEIAMLRWDQFKDGWVTLVGKGDKPAALPVHPVIGSALSRLERNGSPWVFPGSRGRTFAHPASVWNWTREVAAHAGVEGVSPHVLRHSVLATANDATGDLRAVQEFARHSRPETTALYTRATAKRLEAVMHSIDYEGEVVAAPGVAGSHERLDPATPATPGAATTWDTYQEGAPALGQDRASRMTATWWLT